MSENSSKLKLFEVPQIESIQEMLIKSAKTYTNKLALEDLTDYPISKVTYAKLYEYTMRFGSSLQEIGLKPRDHVAVIGENRVQWAIAFLSSMMFDFVIVPVDKGLPHGDILNIIHESDASALIFSSSLMDLFKEKKEVLVKLKHYICMDTEKHENDIYSMTEMIKSENSSDISLPKINPDEVAEIIYTSGSLGRAKGVMLTQKNLATNLGENGPHDTPIGNLVTDAYRWKTGTEIGITVGGSTAQPIYEGPLVGADAFRVVGYGYNTENGLGFRIVKFKLSGADLIAGLEFGLSTAEYNDELFPQVSGMSYSYNLSNPLGQRIVYAEVGGISVDPVQEYSITTNEFLLFALSDPTIIGTEINIIDPFLYTDSSEFQVLNDYVIEKQTISPEYRGSIIADVKTIDNGTIPNDFRLEQNYPNPFNPTTKISWQSPISSWQTLKIYDILGNEVSTIVDEYKSAGAYEFEWNANDLPSGVYFYRLKADNFIHTKKMILIK